MKDIVHLEFSRELKCISHFSYCSRDFEATDVSWLKVALDTKMMGASHGSETKVNQITRNILHIHMFHIIVALLSNLSDFQFLKNDKNFFFCLSDNVRSK